MTDDTQKARLPKTSELAAIGCLSALLTVPHVVPAGVAKLIVEAGVVELDDELDESPPPPQATIRSESSAEIVRR
jgi:hypothetical protein